MNNQLDQVDTVLLALQKLEAGLYTLQKAFYGERLESNERSPWDEYSHMVDSLQDQVDVIKRTIQD